MKFSIVKCMNKECHNYNMELNEGTEICSLCNTPVTLVEIKVNRKLEKIALYLGIIGFIASFGGGAIIGIILGSFILAIIIQFGGLGAIIAGIVVGFMSKSKAAIIIPILAALIGIGMIMFSILM